MESNTGVDRSSEWDRLRSEHLRPRDGRSPSTARGMHHIALLCTDVEKTIGFYQGVLGFPLTELIENRDYPGSTHFFFDIGNGNLLAFFDFPGLDLSDYAEVLGGMHHIAISISRENHVAARESLAAAGIALDFEHDTSIYFRGPDGERVELIADELGEMYGDNVS